MDEHECKVSNACCCYIGALQPEDNCPMHGCGEWPPRCMYCGKFIKWTTAEEQMFIPREQA